MKQLPTCSEKIKDYYSKSGLSSPKLIYAANHKETLQIRMYITSLQQGRIAQKVNAKNKPFELILFLQCKPGFVDCAPLQRHVATHLCRAELKWAKTDGTS